MIVFTLAILVYAYISFSSLTQNGNDSVSSNWYPGLVTTIRLLPGEDVKKALLSFATKNQISSGSVLSAVGSVDGINIRLASAAANTTSHFLTISDKFEVVSLVGTMEHNETEASSYGHFHISVADVSGRVFGGHLMEGCMVHTTLEVVLMQVPRLQNLRVHDYTSGYKELQVIEAERYYAHKVLWTFRKGMQIFLRRITPVVCSWAQVVDPQAVCPANY